MGMGNCGVADDCRHSNRLHHRGDTDSAGQIMTPHRTHTTATSNHAGGRLLLDGRKAN